MVSNCIEEENLEINNDDFLKKIELKEVLADYEKETAMKYFLKHFDKSRQLDAAPKHENKKVAVAEV